MHFREEYVQKAWTLLTYFFHKPKGIQFAALAGNLKMWEEKKGGFHHDTLFNNIESYVLIFLKKNT